MSMVLPVGQHLAKTGLVKGDNILAGSNFIFSTNRNGYFSAEGTGLSSQSMLAVTDVVNLPCVMLSVVKLLNTQ